MAPQQDNQGICNSPSSEKAHIWPEQSPAATHWQTAPVMSRDPDTAATYFCRCCTRKARVSLLAVGRLLMASHSMSRLICGLLCSVGKGGKHMVWEGNTHIVITHTQKNYFSHPIPCTHPSKMVFTCLNIKQIKDFSSTWTQKLCKKLVYLLKYEST